MELMEKEKMSFRKTEIGLIPKDWEIVNLDQIGKFSKGQGVRKDEAQSGNNPCVRYGEIYNKHNNYIKEFHSFISIEVSQTARRIRYGDLLFAGSGETKEEIGKTVAFTQDIDGFAGGDIVILSIANLDKYSPLYLGYLLNTPPVQRAKASLGQGDAVVHISARALENVEIAVPPTLEEQKAIATALSDTDALIAGLEKLIAKKKAIKQGAMQQLLTPPHKGGKRLPRFDGEWEEKKLGELGECIIGLTYSPSNIAKEGVLVLRSSNIQNGKLSFLDNVFVKMNIPQKLRTQIDDLLICVRNGSKNLIGKCALIDDSCVNESFGAFMSMYRSPYNKLIAQIFQTEIIQRQIDENLGATINQITNKVLNSFVVWIPKDEDERTAIASILSDMDKEIEALEIKKAKYERVKQGMMQELLTGKTRLV